MKKSDIQISEGYGPSYQVVVGNSCVTEPFDTPEEAWQDYVHQLITAKEQAEKWLSGVPTW